MQFGYFDEEKKECIITRLDTPAPWVNYLGFSGHSAVISSNAGGYSFIKSGANGRTLRYVFDNFDQPGRYICIKDSADGNYRSVSWQPVGEDLGNYYSRCCHDTGYTRTLADYKGIHSEARYLVPLSRSYEVWNLSVINASNEERELTIIGYIEFINSSNYEQDQVNPQCSQFITRTRFRGDHIRQMTHGNLDGLGENGDIDSKVIIERFFGLVGAPVTSYCGSKEKSIGRYHGYGNPAGVEFSKLSGEMNYNGNSYDALATVIRLTPGEERQITFPFGMKYEGEASAIVVAYEDMKVVCDVRMGELTTHWHEKLSHFQAKTSSKEFDVMINT